MYNNETTSALWRSVGRSLASSCWIRRKPTAANIVTDAVVASRFRSCAVARISSPRTRGFRSCSISAARPFSSLLVVAAAAADADKVKTTKITIQIVHQGKCLSIQSEKNIGEERSMFLAASWLWVHDPNSIHPSSGQKLRTLGQYSVDCHRIVQADWVVLPSAATKEHGEDNDTDVSSSSSPSSVPARMHPPPPPGSYHPRGGVYDTDEELQQNQHRSLLHVTWADGMESYYDLEWLQQFEYSFTSSPTKITSQIAIGATNNPHAVPIPTLNHDSILTTNEGRWNALDGIMEHGAILIRQAPPVRVDQEEKDPLESEATTVADMGKCLSGGRLSHGALYGDTFRVVSQPNAHNIAYTSVALPPHQDLTYYESKPFLQLLHCVSNAPIGGASILIDAMAAAEYLRTVAPDLFTTLCRFEATFVKQRPGANMVSFKPHIVISHHDDGGEVVQVNWSPPFEGPPMMMFGGKEEGSSSIEDMEHYVRAYQAMECLLNNHYHPHQPSTTESSMLISTELQKQLSTYANNYTWEHVLEPGDILVFNNQRMCHGRRAFELEPISSSSSYHSPKRHLIGCYTDAMETVNEYRVLQRTRNNHHPPHQQRWGMRNVGNGTRGSRV